MIKDRIGIHSVLFNTIMNIFFLYIYLQGRLINHQKADKDSKMLLPLGFNQYEEQLHYIHAQLET